MLQFSVSSHKMVSPYVVAACAQVPYSSSFLLPSSFPAFIVEQPQYACACQRGYEAYFELMWEEDTTGDDFVFVPRMHTWAEIVQEVVRDITHEDVSGYCEPVAWRVGFAVGWLSALARTNPVDALAALEIVKVLV